MNGQLIDRAQKFLGRPDDVNDDPEAFILVGSLVTALERAERAMTYSTDEIRSIVREEVRNQMRSLADRLTALKEPPTVDARDAERRSLIDEARRAMDAELRGYALWDVMHLVSRLIEFVETVK